MTTQSLADTLNLCVQSQKTKTVDRNFLKYLRTALKRYVLEGLGLNTKSPGTKAFSESCQQLCLTKLVKKLTAAMEDAASQPDADSGIAVALSQGHQAQFLLTVFDRQFAATLAQNKQAKSTGHSYRSALGRFVQWLEGESFWQLLCSTDIPDFTPQQVSIPQQMSRRKCNTLGEKAEPYGLLQDCLPPHLKKEIEQFREFWTTGGEEDWETLLQQRQAQKEREGIQPKIDSVDTAYFDSKSLPKRTFEKSVR